MPLSPGMVEVDDDDEDGPVFTFFLSWFGFTLVVFPLVATLDSAVFAGNLGQLLVPLISLVVTIPAALEFAFSGRDPYKVGVFVGVFVVLFFLSIVLQAAVAVAMNADEPIPTVQFAMLFLAYIGAYVVVYRIGTDRIKGAFTR